MAPKPQVTDAELEVLQVLWTLGPSRVRDLLAALPEGRWAFTTVQTLLHRLEGKGVVERDRSRGVTRYAATVTRQGLLYRRLEELSKQLGDGSVLSLMHGIAAGRRLGRQEIAGLRQFLDEVEARVATGKRKNSTRRPRRNE